jgi:hypothetical protein
MLGFGPASAPVAACGVLGFLEASSSYKIDYSINETTYYVKTFQTELSYTVLDKSLMARASDQAFPEGCQPTNKSAFGRGSATISKARFSLPTSPNFLQSDFWPRSTDAHPAGLGVSATAHY